MEGSIKLTFSGADLSNSSLVNADLNGADFSHANLNGVSAKRADLGGANLTGANLTGADFSKADLRAANLSGAILNDAILVMMLFWWGPTSLVLFLPKPTSPEVVGMPVHATPMPGPPALWEI